MTPDGDRAAFVARVRKALGRDARAPIGMPPELPEALVRLVKSDSDLVAIFAERATIAGMMVHQTSAGARWECVRTILHSIGAARVVIDSPDEEFTRGRDYITTRGITIIERSPATDTNVVFEADAGISDVFAAVAETGSLVVASGPGRPRSTFIVPPVHIAIVRAEQIVADLLDVSHRFGAMPTALTLVSGPSKTADIEGVLITGVHGPGRVHIVLETT